MWLLYLNISLVVYTYLLFPIFISFMGKFITKSSYQVPSNEPDTISLSITLLVSMHNEELVALDKAKNILELQGSNIETWFLLDACTDNTKLILENYFSKKKANIKIYDSKDRLGKNGCINKILQRIKSDIVIFSDANSMYQENAIIELIKPFADNHIWCVSGREKRCSPNTAKITSADSDVFFWNLDHFTKIGESKFQRLCTANGSMVAMRRSLLESIPDSYPNDFYIPLLALSKRRGSVYQPTAICWEYSSPKIKNEYDRKVRIVNRAVGVFCNLILQLDALSFSFVVSHKFLRWVGIVPLTTIVLQVFYIFYTYYGSKLYLVVSFIFLLYFFTRNLLSQIKVLGALIKAGEYFVLMHVAAFWGFLKRFFGSRISIWNKPN